MAKRLISIEDAINIRELVGTRNPNGTKVTLVQLARDYGVSAFTMCSVVNFKGAYSNDDPTATSEIPLAPMTVGRFLIRLTNTLDRDGDIKPLDIKYQAGALTLRDARKLRSVLSRVLGALD
tara:strand:- start:245 stop:610 length:366 start_codon:yes stop_codon:yes gene_type:complete